MTERDAFLRAICDEPGEDTPRLVYADWLDEHDEHERAEFIRVQCEKEHMLPCEYEVSSGACQKCVAEHRETALLTPVNRAAWSKWQCPECPKRSPDKCGVCLGTGNLFLNGGLHVHFRRGFPHAVEVPEMDAVYDISNLEMHILGNDPIEGYIPTPWLRAVARHTTIEEVWVMDRVPDHQIADATRSKACFGKEAWEWWDHIPASASSNIPSEVFRIMWEKYPDNQDTTTGNQCLEFPIPEAARSVAGRAWVEWARKEEVRG